MGPTFLEPQYTRSHPFRNSGFLLQPLQERAYRNATAKAGGNSVPESRFYSSLYGIWLLPIGLFLAAWTSYPQINFIVPLIGFTLFGSEWRFPRSTRSISLTLRLSVGFFLIITAILNYIVDGYGHCT